jgi:hypothetical protein
MEGQRIAVQPQYTKSKGKKIPQPQHQAPPPPPHTRRPQAVHFDEDDYYDDESDDRMYIPAKKPSLVMQILPYAIAIVIVLIIVGFGYYIWSKFNSPKEEPPQQFLQYPPQHYQGHPHGNSQFLQQQQFFPAQQPHSHSANGFAATSPHPSDHTTVTIVEEVEDAQSEKQQPSSKKTRVELVELIAAGKNAQAQFNATPDASSSPITSTPAVEEDEDEVEVQIQDEDDHPEEFDTEQAIYNNETTRDYNIFMDRQEAFESGNLMDNLDNLD